LHSEQAGAAAYDQQPTRAYHLLSTDSERGDVREVGEGAALDVHVGSAVGGLLAGNGW
jgi:hypothetical protein